MSVNMANREVCNAIFRNYADKKPVLYVDYANTTTTEVTGDNNPAYGGWGHPKRIIFSGEKGGTIAFEFQVHPFQLFAIMSGAEIENQAKFIKREVIKATEAGKLTLGYKGSVTAINVFAKEDDCGVDIGGSATVDAGEVTLAGVEADKEYVVYYEKEVASLDKTSVQALHITSKTFPKALTIDADTIYKTEDDDEIPMILRVYKCQPQPQFTLTHANSGDPGTITLTCDLMADENDNFIDLIAIDED